MNRLKRTIVLLVLANALPLNADEVKKPAYVDLKRGSSDAPLIYVSEGKWGKKFRHFPFELNEENLRILKNPLEKQKERAKKTKDESQDPFTRGAFEVYIVKTAFPFSTSCKRKYMRVYMPETENGNSEFIQAKKDLYFKLHKIAKKSKGKEKVVLEYPAKGCELLFRTAYGEYIDYVGQYKK